MRVSEIVLACVADVHYVSDAEGLNDVCIARMMPITQIQPTGEYLVWVVLCVLSKIQRSRFRLKIRFSTYGFGIMFC